MPFLDASPAMPRSSSKNSSSRKRKRDEEEVYADSYISDDSSFYGSEDEQSRRESNAASFSITEYISKVTAPSPTTLALRALTSPNSTPTSSPRLYNPYSDMESARQIGEPLSSFLDRLRPSIAQGATIGPWIWIANFHSSVRKTSSDYASLTLYGTNILSQLSLDLNRIQKSGLSKVTAGKQMNALRTKTTEALKTLAKTHNVLTGKWLLFALPEDVDRIWGLVAKDTAEGKLGCAAKVATDEGQGERVPRVICVYTRDFLDVEDVRRVGWGLKDLGLVGVRGVWYKCDAYTHLGINSGNEWGLKPTLYGSKDLLVARSEH